MGLDTSHDCWHGPYSSFHSWRKWVAQQIGLPLDQMEGFSGDDPGIPWSIINHPLVPLLAHSDCDGRIRWWDAKQIAIGLGGVLRDFKTEAPPNLGGDERHCLKATRRFMRGCITAYRNREDILFC